MDRLFPGLLLLLLVSPGAFAASSVTSVAVSQAASLPLDGEGTSTERILKVADLNITSDAPLGFTLTVTSGSLSKADGQTPIHFQVLTVASGSPPPTAAAFTTASGDSHVYVSATAGNASRELYIRYTSAALQDPGAYARVVTVTVFDN